MATLKQIQFKRSKVAGVNPTASQLAEGELAINLKDRTLFTKDDLGNIISLGFAKGGDINGNVTQTGDYLQNGTYNLNGNQFVYAGKYIEFLPKTAGNGDWANQHLNKAPIFTDLSSTTSVSEYHPLIKQRYKDGTFSAGTLVNEGSFKFHYIDETGTSKYWTFNRNGNFIVDSGSIEVRAGNISASGNINSANGIITGPEIVTKNINFSTKTFVANANIGYDWVSLPTWVYNPPADGSDNTTNGLNYLRKLRASSASSIFHEIADCRKGKPQEISWWTGVGPESFQWAFDTSGRITAGKSISVGLPDNGTNGRYPLDSAISIGIAIGDNDTGIKWVRDGVIDLMANGISSATILNNGINSTKKLMVGYSRDSGTTWDYPNNNQAMFTARTDVDGNNNGDGQTHIGYNSNAKMYHYFRGTGRMSVSMGEGLIVEPGILDIKTGSNSLNLRADGTIASVQTLKLNNGLYFNGDETNASLVFKAASGIDGTKQIMWEGGTRAGQNKSYVTVKAWGNSFNASGDKSRETVFEVSDGHGPHFYSQRVAPASGQTVGPINFKFNGTVETGHIIGLGNISASGTVSSSRFDALGDIAFKNANNRNIRFEYVNSAGATAVDGYIFKDGPSATNRRPGIRINCSAPNSSTSSGDFVFNEDGNLTVPVQVQPGNFGNFDSRYPKLFQLGANVNLDTLTGDNQLGEYAQHANANTSLDLNYPEALAGHLTVTSGAGVQQTYRVYNSSRVYLRSKYTSAWTPWDRVVTEDYLKTGIPSQFVSKNPDGFRIAYGNYGFFIRNDGGNTYFMLTNSGDQMGPWNGLRPLSINNSNGNVTMSHSLTVGGSSSFNSALTVGNGLTVNGASGINVTSTAGDAISWGNAGACLANDGNLKGTRWNSFGGALWAGDALSWVHGQNVSKSGDTMTGTLTLNNGQIVLNGGSGNIGFTKAGANPRSMRIFHAGDGTRGNRIEIADETNYIAYFQKLPGGQNQVSFNSATLSGLTQCNQFGVNTTNALGGNSITFGDNDTGIKQNGDGLLDIYANNVQVFRFQNGDLYSYKNINAPNVYIRSDVRLKSNFKPIKNALERVEQLDGLIYDKAEYIGGEPVQTEAGIVAQTLQDVLPEAVRETEDSKGNKILTVSSQAQIALLVEAVKTLSSRVKELESKLM